MKLRSNCSRAISPVLGLLLLVSCSGGEEADLGSLPTAEVLQGPLEIAVTEGGDLGSASPEIVVSEVEGRTTVQELKEEGSRVEKGEVIVRLDAGPIEDKINRQQLEYERAVEAVKTATSAVASQEALNKENILRAEKQLEVAKNDRQAYEEGAFKVKIVELESEITLAQENLTRSKDQLEASRRLLKDKFISEDEVRADELKFKQAQQRLELAKIRKKEFETWTSRTERLKLDTEIQLKKSALARVADQARIDLQQKQSALASRVKSEGLELEALNKLKEQLKKTVVRAPISGLLVYARESRRRWRSEEPMAKGKEVREKEELVRISNEGAMIVEVDVHESAIKKVRKGLPAEVTVDAVPGKTMQGFVQSVAVVPSSQSSWLNPDLKVYKVVVKLVEVVPDLKPGMHAQVKIIVADLADVVQVPMQAIKTSGDQTFAFVKGGGGDGYELREVEVGRHNETMVEVKSGLEPGEVVFLKAPPGATLPEPEQKEEGEDSDRPRAQKQPGTAAAAEAPGAVPGKGSGGKGKGGGRVKMTPEERKRFMSMSTEEKRAFIQSKREKAQRGGDPERE